MNLDSLYTPKQQKVLNQYLNSNFFIMVNDGSVRAGKTEIDNDIFLMELRQIKKRANKKGIKNPQYICAGSSIATFYRNVIMQINNKYDMEIKLDKYNSFNLFDVKCTVFGHEKINDLNKITGMEAWGAYINEGTKANEFVFDEIPKRCSGEGSRIIIDTNPDNPEHYLKKDYIDKADGKRIIHNRFLIEENTFLSEEYIENVKATTPSGVFYKRKILSLWCMADGVIYEDFNDEIHFISPQQVPWNRIKKYYCGVDWGYAEGHEGSIVVIGEDDLGISYLVQEISKTKKDIDWWVDKAKEIKKYYSNLALNAYIYELKNKFNREPNEREIEALKREVEIIYYADTARPEHIWKFQENGLFTLNAEKSVESGIEEVAKLWKTNKLYVVKQNTTLFPKEIYGYIWGKDGKPKKEMDNSLDALRYAIYTPRSVSQFKIYA